MSQLYSFVIHTQVSWNLILILVIVVFVFLLLVLLFDVVLVLRFGRWTMIAISTVSYTVLALGSAWLPFMSLLLVARFLMGTMHPASLMTGYILGAYRTTEP